MGVDIPGMQGQSAMSELDREGMLKHLEGAKWVVEIGTLNGATAAYFAKKMPKTIFMSVDPFRAAKGTGAGNISNWLANHQANQFLFVGTFREFMRFALAFVPDVVIVDGDHSYEGTLEDLIQAATIRCKRIILHDYGRSEPLLQDVTRACEVFLQKYRYKKGKAIGTVIAMELEENA